MLGKNIPLEICPTSNMRTLVLKSLTDHPTLDFWLKKGYPIVFCTDDAGIFQTTLSKELFKVCKTFKLKRK